MEPGNIVRVIFGLRLKAFCNNLEESRKNRFRSPIFNILDVAVIYGVLGPIQDMTEGKIPVVSKRAWSQLVRDRASKDANWRATNFIYKDNDLLMNTLGETRYLTWWAISDLDHRLVRMCEDLSKIICHASRLKRDDFRLKGLTMSNKTCINCDLYCIEDVCHIVTQCPFYQDDREMMYDEIFRRCPSVKDALSDDHSNILYYLLGKKIKVLGDEEMLCFWCISGNAISRMHRKAVASRTGVG